MRKHLFLKTSSHEVQHNQREKIPCCLASHCVGYAERAREGAKFVVADKPPRTTKRGLAQAPTDGTAQQEGQDGVGAGNGDDENWLAEQGFEPFGELGADAEGGEQGEGDAEDA